MNKDARRIWEKPWSYTEGFIVAGGIALTGLLLQLLLGNIRPADFRSPVNTTVGALLVAGLLCCHFLLRDNHVVRWLSGARSTVPAMLVVLLSLAILGLTPHFTIHEPQVHLTKPNFSRIGWYRMPPPCAFLVLCFYILVILGLIDV